MAHLTLLLDNREVRKFVLNRGVTTIGRAQDNDIVINNLALSRRHAQVEFKSGRFDVVDLQSQNGVYVNQERVRGPRALDDRDSITLGTYQFVFRSSEDSEPEVKVSPQRPRPRPETTDAGKDDEESQAPEAAVPLLVLKYNDVELQRFPITVESCLVGRAKECDVQIPERRLSRKHCEIRTIAGKYQVNDLGSQNGTYVNRRRIKGTHDLAHGDVLNFAEYSVLFLAEAGQYQGPDAEPASGRPGRPSVVPGFEKEQTAMPRAYKEEEPRRGARDEEPRRAREEEPRRVREEEPRRAREEEPRRVREDERREDPRRTRDEDPPAPRRARDDERRARDDDARRAREDERPVRPSDVSDPDDESVPQPPMHMSPKARRAPVVDDEAPREPLIKSPTEARSKRINKIVRPTEPPRRSEQPPPPSPPPSAPAPPPPSPSRRSVPVSEPEPQPIPLSQKRQSLAAKEKDSGPNMGRAGAVRVEALQKKRGSVPPPRVEESDIADPDMPDRDEDLDDWYDQRNEKSEMFDRPVPPEEDDDDLGSAADEPDSLLPPRGQSSVSQVLSQMMVGKNDVDSNLKQPKARKRRFAVDVRHHQKLLYSGPLNESVTILGTDREADIQLKGRYVAGRHSLLVRVRDSLLLVRLGSSSAARVNGLPKLQAFLKTGDVIQIDETTITVTEE